MPKSRNRKDHKKKTSNRNNKIKEDRIRIQNAQKDFFMKLIEEEKKKGLFNTPSTDGPILDGPILE